MFSQTFRDFVIRSCERMAVAVNIIAMLCNWVTNMLMVDYKTDFMRYQSSQSRQNYKIWWKCNRRRGDSTNQWLQICISLSRSFIQSHEITRTMIKTVDPQLYFYYSDQAISYWTINSIISDNLRLLCLFAHSISNLAEIGEQHNNLIRAYRQWPIMSTGDLTYATATDRPWSWVTK